MTTEPAISVNGRAAKLVEQLLADAAALNFEVAPVDGERVQAFVEKLLRTPRQIAARARHLVE